MERRVLAVATGLAVVALLAGSASAGEEDLRRELDETKAQVRKLLERVEQLEGRTGQEGDIGKAVETYLAQRPADPGSNVSAPRSRKLRFSGHILAWWEQWNGSRGPRDPSPTGSDVENQGWLRTSLQMDADITGDLRARVEIRDARVWGSEPSTTAQLQTAGTGTDLKQGWFESDDLFGCGTKTRAGRQVLSFGDQRLVGELDWATYGRSFDGLLFTHLYGETKVDLFATRVVERNEKYKGDIDDRDFLGVYTATPKALGHSDLDVYLLFLHDGRAAAGEQAGDEGNTSLVTGGFRLAGAAESLDWGAEGAVQSGRLAGDGLFAWAAHARAGYTMKDTKWTPRIGIEGDWATGDDDGTDGDAGSFQTLFPTNHVHYGIMDLAAWQNMRAVRASLGVNPAERWTIQADFWRLWLDDAADAWYGASGAVIRPGSPGASKYLGSEVDLVATWKASDSMKVAFGAAQFFDGGFVRDTGRDGGGDTFWFYVRVQVFF